MAFLEGLNLAAHQDRYDGHVGDLLVENAKREVFSSRSTFVTASGSRAGRVNGELSTVMALAEGNLDFFTVARDAVICRCEDFRMNQSSGAGSYADFEKGYGREVAGLCFLAPNDPREWS